MQELVIKSNDSSASLVFSNFEGDYFTARFHSPALSVSKRVYAYQDWKSLVNLFEYLAKKWKGWDGEKNWSSIEREFSISCSSDKTGHVYFKLKFREVSYQEPWVAEPSLNLEAGQLEGISKQVRIFFLC